MSSARSLADSYRSRRSFARHCIVIQSRSPNGVFEDGRLIEHGSHAELLARGGSYARLHAQQFADQGLLEGGEAAPAQEDLRARA